MATACLVAVLAAGAVCTDARDARALVWPDVPERIERALSSQDPQARRVAARELSNVGSARGTRLVLQALGDGDVEVRLAAAESAVRLRVRGATDAVLPWLGDRETRLRIAACDVARALPNARTVPQLARALGDADAAVRSSAADALGAQASPDAVPALLGKLDDPSPPVRIHVARALARLDDKRAVVPLVGKVQDSVPDVRQAVARALGELGDKRASQALLLVLRDNVPEVRVEALAALGRMRASDAVDGIAPLAVDRNPALRQAALAALGRIGTREAVLALVSALGVGEDAGGGLERTPVREALTAAGPVATTELGALLGGSPGPTVATSAAWVLGELRAQAQAPVIVSAMRRGVLGTVPALHALAGAGAPESVAIVLEFIGDKSPAVRAAAVRAAGAMLDPSKPDGRAVEPVAAALRNATLQASERAALADLLGRTGAPRAAPVLAGLIAAKDPALRLAAIDAMGMLGPAGADDPLLEAIKDTEAAVRLHAAVALAESGGPRAQTALLAELDRGGELDRAALFTALGGIASRAGDDAVARRLGKHLEITAGPERDGLLLAIGRAPAATAIKSLEDLSRAADASDRRTVASVLAVQAKNPRALAIATSLLNDPEPSVVAQAAWTVGWLGDARAAAELARLTRGTNGDAAVNATAAIGRIASRTSPPLITRLVCPLLGDARTHVRSNALVGLAASRARCADGAERRLLAEDPSDRVRAAAARVVGESSSDEDRMALERCAQTDRSGSVARGCRTVRASGPAAARRRPNSRAVEVYVLPESSAAPRPHAHYLLELADGYIRAGQADRRGAIFEPFPGDGEIALDRP